jgi:predicted Rossmann fold flavoprotein
MSSAADDTADLVIVGAGAAGLATAIFAAHAAPGRRIVCLDGARHIGAKILVSGGARCNVTNRVVTERDFWGGASRVIRHVLRAFPAERAAAFFTTLGVPLHEEEDGKLFPDSNRARSVLDALLAEADRCGVVLRARQRVTSVASRGDRFQVGVMDGPDYVARMLVLATGGRSLPKTGSDGAGYALAASLGHGCVDTTPALAPLLLDDDRHAALSGISHPAEIAVVIDSRLSVRLRGSLLWSHFGATGPVVLNASRHWHRARLEGAVVELRLNSCPGETFESVEEWLLDRQRERPKAAIATVLATRLPAAVAAACAAAAGLDPALTMSHISRDARRALVRAVVEQPLQVRDSRGYNFAEATAGGVPLDEIDPATLESRRCDDLFLVGEVLDVDGRLGGFNFQWAWSSAFVAGAAIGARLRLEV